MAISERFLEPHQARQRPATSYEDLLADAVERTFSRGVHDLMGLVASLNEKGPVGENGELWTEQSFTQAMSRLGY